MGAKRPSPAACPAARRGELTLQAAHAFSSMCCMPQCALQHALMECPRYAALRSEYSDLFLPVTSLAELLGGPDQLRLSSFVERCRVASQEDH